MRIIIIIRFIFCLLIFEAKLMFKLAFGRLEVKQVDFPEPVVRTTRRK